ncbi:long-chain fatty acid--CoA ligase [Tsukamurella sp. 8F]|uniref:acyl-CoA synthetase n=1 Tax=unclassified Tsukamurella TaxID=2633480 RepID=UPI0023B8EAC1|nr:MULTISPECIES: long-chain fatty acid--CoA ligase [unclassified Tsukamurella]MDF0530331.1 long-chain fatty acid--CoA ligase [Tsukamurella sp. 8J]MDF0587628.1 long-chain fatty acid--CoA ligase [Tsukamurella sp. 8F]
MDLGSWIGRRAASSARRRAVTYQDRTWTYGEFLERIDRLAAELSAGGVGVGDRVGYVGFNHPDFLTAMFAASRVGAVFVPINFRLTGPEFEFILSDAGVHTLIADADRAAAVDPVRATAGVRRAIALTPVAGWETLDDLIAAREPLAEPVHPGADDVAVVMYTSGTTGRPKGAMLTHGNLFWNNMNSLLSLDTLSTDVSLVVAPMFHIGGLNVTTLLTLQKGGELVIMPAFDPAGALELIARHRVTTMFGVPAMFLFMSQVPGFADADLSSVRSFVCGGAPVPEPLIRIYNERGVPFAQGYGLTETAPLALVMRTDETAERIGAAGHAVLPLSDVALLTPDGARVAPGERGEVCVRGPQVTAGYWNRPDATEAAIDSDGWFHTGDVGQADDDGYVTVVDRVKDMVITGGENVYPAEVESVLYRHPAVAEVAVIGTPDEKWGESVTAVVALKPGAQLTLEEIRDFAKDSLAGYKLPRRLDVVDALPRNPAGKVLKFRLREDVREPSVQVTAPPSYDANQ